MRISAFCAAVLTYVVIGHTPPAAAQVDQQLAEEYFKEARALCEAPRRSFVGRVDLRADGDRRQADTDDRHQPAGTGRGSPATARSLNAPVQWGGATWSAYMWGDVVNRTPRERKELFLHELFHCVQPQLGLTAESLDSEHLDAADGRYWLRLEWRALAWALRESGEPRNLAVRSRVHRELRRDVSPA